jgi:hypothetical protein
MQEQRLRRALLDLALTSGNVLARDPSGHALGTGRKAAGHVLADQRWCLTDDGGTAA